MDHSAKPDPMSAKLGPAPAQVTPTPADEHISQLEGYFILCNSYDALAAIIHTYFENTPDLCCLLPECDRIIETYSKITTRAPATAQPLPSHPVYIDALGVPDEDHFISIENRQIANLHEKIIDLIRTHLS